MAPSNTKRPSNEDPTYHPGTSSKRARNNKQPEQNDTLQEDEQLDIQSRIDVIESKQATFEADVRALKAKFTTFESTCPHSRKVLEESTQPAPTLKELILQPNGSTSLVKPKSRGKVETLKSLKADNDNLREALQKMYYKNEEYAAIFDRVEITWFVDELSSVEMLSEDWAINAWRINNRVSNKSKMTSRGRQTLDQVSAFREADLRSDSKATMKALVSKAIAETLNLELDELPIRYKGILDLWRGLEPELLSRAGSASKSPDITELQKTLGWHGLSFNVLGKLIPLNAFDTAISRKSDSLLHDLQGVFRIESPEDLRHGLNDLLERTLRIALAIHSSRDYIRIIQILPSTEDIYYDSARMRATKDGEGNTELGTVVLGTCFPGLELLNEETMQMDVKLKALVKVGDITMKRKRASRDESPARAQAPRTRSKATQSESRANDATSSGVKSWSNGHCEAESSDLHEFSKTPSGTPSRGEFDTIERDYKDKTVYSHQYLFAPPLTTKEDNNSSDGTFRGVKVDRGDRLKKDLQESSATKCTENRGRICGLASASRSPGSPTEPIKIEDAEDSGVSGDDEGLKDTCIGEEDLGTS